MISLGYSLTRQIIQVIMIYGFAAVLYLGKLRYVAGMVYCGYCIVFLYGIRN